MKLTRLALRRLEPGQHLVPFFGERPLSKIAPFDVQRFVKQRRDAGAAASTINAVYP